MGAAHLQEGSTAKLAGFGEALQAIFFPGFLVVSPRWGFKKEDDLFPMVNTIGNDLSLRCSFFKDEP
jgi:hypothetical protein